ncbi:MAG: 1-acyl-sn-glycerol-3-phosphate acyltransferase [Clostridia bacterium]|nr:1-acyl-sn-glycerol-3-phosphate acyltransferase [Clostridia bacterium]
MKIKTVDLPLDKALLITPPPQKKVVKPSRLFSTLIRIISAPDLIATKFTFKKERMDLAGKGPYLVLMNHSAFIDLKIAFKLLYPKRFYIVMTTDGMVGKKWLMEQIGCIPTKKFVPDMSLVASLNDALNNQKISVLMFPEAGYSFDGTATALPKKFGTIIKKLGVPVVTIITDGAYLRQPLYNNLLTRKVKTSAKMKCLLTKDEIALLSSKEIDDLIEKEFTFDNFKAQYDNKIKITENTRAEGLNRILYKCPNCKKEGLMQTKHDTITCNGCGKTYHLTEYGNITTSNNDAEFNFVSDWYKWEREEVKKELLSNDYKLDVDVDIGILNDYKALYMVGSGRLTHDKNGFNLFDKDGNLLYSQTPTFTYSLNADFYWYEIGDVISIGDNNRLYYLFPKQKDVVAKTRLATEELYKIIKKQ